MSICTASCSHFWKVENSEAAQGSCRTCFHYKVANNMANAVCRQHIRFQSNEKQCSFLFVIREEPQRRRQKPFPLAIPWRRRRPQNIEMPKHICGRQSPPMSSFAHTQFRIIDKMSFNRRVNGERWHAIAPIYAANDKTPSPPRASCRTCTRMRGGNFIQLNFQWLNKQREHAPIGPRVPW